jgi:hypothetical protein
MPLPLPSFQQLTLPDLWQQEAVHALRAGNDVVVDAPTGAGKTLVFELLHRSLRGQAIYTVPTRALANDKLREWRAKDWEVGICTGDVVEDLDAKVVVATLETQKVKFLRREGPTLLVIDEYQLIGDPNRGVSYELSVALAPGKTQLLLLSGSVANPQDVVAWLERLGRKATLVQHRERPVPLEEVDLETLPNRAPASVRGWWPRVIANALAADLGPILLFAPRRKAAEKFAEQLAAALPGEGAVSLSQEEQLLAGSALARLLRQGVAYHHSGLSYSQRAGLIEPLAKKGKLRVIVATMGLAAGINFSMRSVIVSGTSYFADNLEHHVRPDELLQMYGRAGRRGLDEIGYALVTPQPPRLMDARPLQLRRAEPLDWPTLIAVMQSAIERGEEPFQSALDLNRRLFTPREIPIGIEHSRETGPMPCGLSVDMERARFLRRGAVEMLNSRGEWQIKPEMPTPKPLGATLVRSKDQWRPALSAPATIERRGIGQIRKFGEGRDRQVGREIVLGNRREGGLALAPALAQRFARKRVTFDELQSEIIPKLIALSGGHLSSVEPRGEQLIALFRYDHVIVDAWIDTHGAALLSPPERRDLPLPCRECVEQPWCSSVEIVTQAAHAWRRLGLIEPNGVPTRRGIIFSYFHHGEGLAIAAALEDEAYSIADLVFDLANLRAGPRFAGEDSPLSGRLGLRSQQTYERADYAGYLTMGTPVDYGAGASEAVRACIDLNVPRSKLLSENLRAGDFERAIIEWRSLLRHIVWAPDCDWPRWWELKAASAAMLDRTESERLSTLVSSVRRAR